MLGALSQMCNDVLPPKRDRARLMLKYDKMLKRYTRRVAAEQRRREAAVLAAIDPLSGACVRAACTEG